MKSFQKLTNSFKKLKIPEKVYQKILDFLKHQSQEKIAETPETGVEDFVLNNHSDPSTMEQLPESLRTEILAALKPTLSGWCGLHIQPSFVLAAYNP